MTNILLVGNYLPDAQESMQRFSRMLQAGLTAKGFTVAQIRPEPKVNCIPFLPPLLKKWIGYLDKFIIFPARLKTAAKRADIVHICDHSNAMYLNEISGIPHSITCHDLLAVRGAMGEDTGCRSSWTGKILQSWILKSLRRADMIVCDSSCTKRDVERLLGNSKTKVVHIGLNNKYQILPNSQTTRLLAPVSGLSLTSPYLLAVGSAELRKNRQGILRIFAKIRHEFGGQLVFAGQPLTIQLRHLADKLGIAERVFEIISPPDQLLAALYNRAFALIFPSLSEGFGWPVIEAQACGCPVVASNIGPLPEVSGQAALLVNVEDEEGFSASILSLNDPAIRQALVTAGLENAKAFDVDSMSSRYAELFQKLLN